MGISCVIVGLGRIGMGYDFNLAGESAIYTHARAISLHPQFQLVGAVDVLPTNRTLFEQRFNAPVFDHVDTALRKLQPEVVVISTPSESHATILEEVLDSCRPKMILCEKPLAYEREEARGMVQLCELAEIDLFVNYIRRTDPGVVEIKRRIEQSEIMTPVKVNVWYSKGILNNGSHLLNMLELWLGNVSKTRIIRVGRLWNNRDPEPDFEVQFERGTAVFQSVWEEYFSHYSIELLSHSGRLRYDRGGEVIEWEGVQVDSMFNEHAILGKSREVITNGMAIYQWHTYEQMFRHITGEKTTLCTGFQALKTLEAIDLILEQRKL